MTKPTPAQIEAALEAFHYTPTAAGLPARINAALTAAAEVGKCETCGGRGYVVQDAEWKPIAVQCPDCRTAAAEVGEPCPKKMLPNEVYEALSLKKKPIPWEMAVHQDEIINAEIRNATIERCAQVVTEWPHRIKFKHELIAAIRALKDK